MSQRTDKMSVEDRRKRRETISQMIAAGAGVSEVARMFGVTTEQVRRSCVEYAVVYPGQRQPAKVDTSCTRAAPQCQCNSPA